MSNVEVFSHSGPDTYTWAGDLQSENLGRNWLVDGILEQNRIYQLYGDWKTGKSLVVMDMCAHLSLAMDWAGRETVKALVVWVAGESVDDMKARLQAFIQHKGVKATDMSFHLRKRPVYLTQLEAAADLRIEIDALRAMYPGLPVLLVIDTLNRNFGPGASENSDEGMGAFVSNLIDSVARPHNATVIVVHHAGHGDKERGRGHSSLPAAVDGTLKVEKTGVSPEFVCLSVQEARSTPTDGSACFRIDTCELPWRDNFGRPMVAPVLHWTSEAPAKGKEKGLGAKQKQALGILEGLYANARLNLTEQGRDPGDALIDMASWRDACKNAGVFKVRQSWKDLWGSLQDRRAIVLQGIHVRVSEDSGVSNVSKP